MPLAAGKEGEDDGSGFRTRLSTRRRLSESHEDEPAALPCRGRKRGKCASSSTAAAAAPSRMTTRSSLSSSRIQSEGRMIRSAFVGVLGQRGEPSGADEGCDEGESRETNKRNLAEEVVLPSDAATEEEQDKAEEASSATSSPLCQPYIHREFLQKDSSGESIYKPIDSETFRAYEQSDTKFQEKQARQLKLPTLKRFNLNTYLGESASVAAIRAGKFVFALSSSIGDTPLAQCTGILVDWDPVNDGTAFILTSANLICSERPSLDSWLCTDMYETNAKVSAHFLDKTSEACNLLYLQKHYNIALFTTKMKGPVELPSFIDNVNCGQSVLLIGRDEKTNLRISRGQVQHLNPTLFERHHFMHMCCTDAAPNCIAGGLVIDFDSKVLGMSEANMKGSFVPSSIVLKWLHLWKIYRRIPRLHLQLKLCAIQFLDPAQIERILYECGIDKGLIVKEVSYESVAEKNGIRVGDVVESLNGECITNLVELEMLLLHLSQQLLERNGGDSKDIELGLYHTRRSKRRVIKMTVKLTDEGEYVARGDEAVTEVRPFTPVRPHSLISSPAKANTPITLGEIPSKALVAMIAKGPTTYVDNEMKALPDFTINNLIGSRSPVFKGVSLMRRNVL